MISKNHELTERDLAVLRHVGRYRLSLTSVLRQIPAFQNGGKNAPKNVLSRLGKDGYLRWPPNKLVKNISYYQLTPEGSRTIGLEDPSNDLGDQAFHTWLSVLWFCHMMRETRQLFSAAKVEELFGPATIPLRGPYCVEPRGDDSTLYHIYAPMPDTRKRTITRQVKDHLSSARGHEKIREWIEIDEQDGKRHFAFAVLLGTRTLKDQVHAALGAQQLFDEAKFKLEVTPSAITVPTFLKEHSKVRAR